MFAEQSQTKFEMGNDDGERNDEPRDHQISTKTFLIEPNFSVCLLTRFFTLPPVPLFVSLTSSLSVFTEFISWKNYFFLPKTTIDEKYVNTFKFRSVVWSSNYIFYDDF